MKNNRKNFIVSLDKDICEVLDSARKPLYLSRNAYIGIILNHYVNNKLITDELITKQTERIYYENNIAR